LENAADSYVAVLSDIIQKHVNFTAQEAIIVIKDIFRKYPNRYESILATMCESLEKLDDPQAKMAMIWILGQYADRIENSDAFLSEFLKTFLDEPVDIQLTLLTATVKLFLKRPSAGSDMVTCVLEWATEEVAHPDCRDRGYMYMRLLSEEVSVAKEVVLGQLPPIKSHLERLDRHILDQMLLNGTTLTTVFHRQPHTVSRGFKMRYLPDSPALEDGARMYASSHLHFAPSI